MRATATDRARKGSRTASFAAPRDRSARQVENASQIDFPLTHRKQSARPHPARQASATTEDRRATASGDLMLRQTYRTSHPKTCHLKPNPLFLIASEIIRNLRNPSISNRSAFLIDSKTAFSASAFSSASFASSASCASVDLYLTIQSAYFIMHLRLDSATTSIRRLKQ